MSEINFLPNRFIRKRQSRRRLIFELLIVVTIAAGLGYGFQLLNAQVVDLEAKAEQIDLQGTVALAKAKEAKRLRSEFNQFASSLRVQREVGLPVNHSNILATIASLQPNAVGLTELVVEVDRPNPVPPVDPNAKKKPKKTKGSSSKTVSDLRIQMVGIAPDDDQITDFYGRLDNHPLFRNVKLEFSRQIKVDNLLGMRFRITCTIALDRIYRSKSHQEELADAN